MANERDDALRVRLLSMFKVEADERLRAISTGLLELEKSAMVEGRAGLLESVFREAHSLKGAARAVDMTQIESACHALESVLASLKREELVSTPELFDALHQTVDHVALVVASVEASPGDDETRAESAGLQRAVSALKGFPARGREEAPEEAQGIAEAPEGHLGPAHEEAARLARGEPQWGETIRVAAGRLDSLLHQVEGLLESKSATARWVAELETMRSAFADLRRERARILQPGLDGRDGGALKAEATSFEAYVRWSDAWFKTLGAGVGGLLQAAERDHRAFAGKIDTLLDDTKRVLMVPASSLLEVIPRMVRNLARDQGKEAEVVIEGGDTAIDRRVLEELQNPLIHLVRNCVDHGIEPPGLREDRGKSRQGTITIQLYPRSGDRFDILVSDDGAGVDVATVGAAATRLGLAPDSELSTDEALSLVFRSGLSTSPLITDVSGRGLGLAIVLEKIEGLGGTITLETEEGGGTTFRATLPSTLTTFRGLSVRVGKRFFILPIAGVEQVARVKASEIGTVENRETVVVGAERMSLVPLSAVLDVPQSSRNHDEHVPLVVIASRGTRLAFAVDEIDGEQEVLVRGLGRHLTRLRKVAGASVQAAGAVVPVLDAAELVEAALKLGVTPSDTGAHDGKPVEARKRNVLVVEDSITSRTLLKNVLEAAGYHVRTAVDGVDALTVLGTEDVDLVVSDVEMPRMDGFDLTGRLRSDDRFAELPVVLVTALQSREDRERGIDVGANAYIVKSSFDQGDLLSVIERLI